jgi:thiol-disulfide isomerase/thioredoxin
MNTKVSIGIVIIVAIAIGFGVYASNNSRKETVKNDAMMQKEVMEKEQVMADGAIKKDEATMMDKKIETSDTMMKTGSYEAYSPEKIARAESGDVVLFFHASWCPSCRGLNSNLEKNADAIPQGLSILKVDYDKETELKKKYGVTTQHTLVQVDKDGNMIKKWSGGSKLENLVSQVQ